MCMICIDLDKMTLEQAIVNLFEMKETIGQPHTEQVAIKIVIKTIGRTVVGNPPEKKYREMIDGIVEFALKDTGKALLMEESSSCV
jgi:hypothetical protein